MRFPSLLPVGSLLLILIPSPGTAQIATASPATVLPIGAPTDPLPSEAASAGVTRFSFIAYGDTRNSHDGQLLQEVHGEVITAMLGRIKAMAMGPDPVRFVLQSGDAVANGSVAQQLNISYVPLINQITVGADMPYFFAAGNHDVGTASDLTNARRLSGLANLLAANANLFPPDGSPRRLAGYPVYAFGYGNTFLLTLDTQIADDPTQFAWLKAQLAGLDRDRYVNIVVVGHSPAFSSGGHGGPRLEPATKAVRELWLPLFRQYHVKLMLVGHEHEFEHWAEFYQDASGSHRFDQIVTGGGGAPLYEYTSEPDLTEYLAAGAAQHVRVEHLVRPAADTMATPHHYVIIHVDGAQLTAEVVGVGRGAGYKPYHGSATLLLTETGAVNTRPPATRSGH